MRSSDRAKAVSAIAGSLPPRACPSVGFAQPRQGIPAQPAGRAGALTQCMAGHFVLQIVRLREHLPERIRVFVEFLAENIDPQQFAF